MWVPRTEEHIIADLIHSDRRNLTKCRSSLSTAQISVVRVAQRLFVCVGIPGQAAGSARRVSHNTAKSNGCSLRF